MTNEEAQELRLRLRRAFESMPYGGTANIGMPPRITDRWDLEEAETWLTFVATAAERLQSTLSWVAEEGDKRDGELADYRNLSHSIQRIAKRLVGEQGS